MAGPNIDVFNNIIMGEQTSTGVDLWDPYGDWVPKIHTNVMYNNAGGNTAACGACAKKAGFFLVLLPRQKVLNS